MAWPDRWPTGRSIASRAPDPGMPGIAACVRCGSTDLRIPGLGDGVVPETDNLMLWVCRACGWQGTPLELDDEASLRAFRRDLAEAGAR